MRSPPCSAPSHRQAFFTPPSVSARPPSSSPSSTPRSRGRASRARPPAWRGGGKPPAVGAESESEAKLKTLEAMFREAREELSAAQVARLLRVAVEGKDDEATAYEQEYMASMAGRRSSKGKN